MKVSEVAAFLEADVFSGKEHLDMDVYCACGADLMSDVLAFVKHDAILLTGLVNPHVIRTADMMDIKVCLLYTSLQCDFVHPSESAGWRQARKTPLNKCPLNCEHSIAYPVNKNSGLKPAFRATPYPSLPLFSVSWHIG